MLAYREKKCIRRNKCEHTKRSVCVEREKVRECVSEMIDDGSVMQECEFRLLWTTLRNFGPKHFVFSKSAKVQLSTEWGSNVINTTLASTDVVLLAPAFLN